MQTTVFTDGFQELDSGSVPYADSTNPAVYFHSERGTLGKWSVASSLRQEGFSKAWQIRTDEGKNYLAQTYTNLNQQNGPTSLITHPLMVAGDTLWNDYTIDFEFTPLAKFDKCGVVFKYRNPTEFYFFGIEGNTVILKQIQQSVTPLRPIERILDVRPLVWTPGEKFRATVTVRRNKISTILNDSIRMHAEGLPIQSGRIGLISDLPARFHRVEVKILKGEQRKLNRRKRQLARKVDLQLRGHPEMVRWKMFDTRGFGTNQNIRLGDLTGDGNKEIVFIRPGHTMDPFITYISAMNLDGEILWQYGNPDAITVNEGNELPVQIHDLDGDGTREIIFVSDGWIHILEGKNGELVRRVQVPGSFTVNTIIFGDLMGIGRDNCMLLSDRQRNLLVLNERLELLWEQVLENGSQPMVHDMNGDGRHDVLMGYSVFDHQGNLMFDVGAFIGDRCNGISLYELQERGRTIPCLIYAAGDWGLMYFDFEGNLLKQNIMGHVKYLSVADLDAEMPGLEVATSNGWGSDGLVHILDASGQVNSRFIPVSGVSRCQPVNWKGDGEEFFITTADSIMGGMFDGHGQLSVVFPSDGHPVSCFMVYDLTGDARDEVLVWDNQELWIYTQDDNPRMGNTYAPDRIPLYNHSMHHMNRSLPGW
ncbi:MAG: hypothetical protein KAR19_09920 [Bacteroidales bacterium]|nr:hypothetical protein [Bacteroidales bacterium]